MIKIKSLENQEIISQKKSIFEKEPSIFEKDPNLIISNNDGMIAADYYLIDEITTNDKYVPLIHTLNVLSSNDKITIHICSPGGMVDTALQIMYAMDQCEAEITTIAEGLCASAATYIWLSGHNIYSAPHSSFLFHTCSYGEFGKFNEVNDRHGFFTTWFEKIMKKIYKGFLTDEEIDQMNSGKDFWFDAEAAMNRLQAVKSLEIRANQLIDTLTSKYKDELIAKVNDIYEDNGNINEENLIELEKDLLQDEEEKPSKTRKNKK